MSAPKLDPQWMEFYDQNVAKAVEAGEDAPRYVISLIRAVTGMDTRTPEENLAHVAYILKAYQAQGKEEHYDPERH